MLTDGHRHSGIHYRNKQLLTTAFNEFYQIIFVNFAHNALKTLPAGLFDDVEAIGVLNLSYNSINSLPENLLPDVNIHFKPSK